MFGTESNSNPRQRCFARKAPENSPPLIQSGNLVFQAHHVGWISAGVFTIVSTVTSLWLVNKHLQWYTNKREQRYIVRLLFMVPIYAIVSLSSYFFWDHATALILLRDGYESTVLTAFFYLLLMYLSPNPDEQKAIFLKLGLSRHADREARKRKVKLKKWIFPLGFVKWKPKDGLFFLQLMKWGVLQYCVLRPLTTLIAVGLNYFGLYCEESWSPGWGHIYIVLIVSLSVTIAMYCLIQLYVPIAKQLAPHKPLLKLFAIKAVVFLTFWQATGLSVLSMFGVVKDTRYMTVEDINVGIKALLETFEMMIFAFLHIRAFTYKPYLPHHTAGSDPPTPTKRLKSLGHAFDFRETFREIWTGCIYIADRLKGREPRPDKGARRVAHLEAAFGQLRPGFEGSKLLDGHGVDRKKGKEGEFADRDGEPRKVEIQAEVVAECHEGERVWLKDHRRDQSEGLEQQIERELQNRGYGLEIRGREPEDDGDIEIGQARQHKPQRSWWRSVYDRISQTMPDPEADHLASGPSMHRSCSKLHSRHSRPLSPARDLNHTSLLQEEGDDYEDPPPASVIRNYRESRSLSVDIGHRQAETDVLTPLVVFDQRHQQLQHRDLPLPPNPTYGSNLVVPQAQVFRNDSLLDRVFPHGSAASSIDHDNESAVSSTPSQSTPRARLMPVSPVVLTQVPGYRPSPGMDGYQEGSQAHQLPSPPEVVIHGLGYEEPSPLPASQRPVHGQDAHFRSTSSQAIVVAPDTDPTPVSTPSFHRRESAHSVVCDVDVPPSPSNRREENDRHHRSSESPNDVFQDESPPHSSHRREAAHAHYNTFLIPRKPPPPLVPDHPNDNAGPSLASGEPSVPGPITTRLLHRNSRQSTYQPPSVANQRTSARVSPFSTSFPSRSQRRAATSPVPKPQPDSSRVLHGRFVVKPTRLSRSNRGISTPFDRPLVHTPSMSQHTTNHLNRSSTNNATGSTISPLPPQTQQDVIRRCPHPSPRISHRLPPRPSGFPIPVLPSPLNRSPRAALLRSTGTRYPNFKIANPALLAPLEKPPMLQRSA